MHRSWRNFEFFDTVRHGFLEPNLLQGFSIRYARDSIRFRGHSLVRQTHHHVHAESSRPHCRLFAITCDLLRLHRGRALRLRGDLFAIRPRHGPSVSHVRSVLLEYSYVVRFCRTEQHSPRAGWLLPVDARGFWRFLGISMRMVELGRHILTEQPIWSPGNGLPRSLSSGPLRECPVGRRLPGAFHLRLPQRPRYSGFRMDRHSDARGSSHPGRWALFGFPFTPALLAFCAVSPAGPYIWRRLRTRARAGYVELRRVRTTLECHRGNGKSAKDVSASPAVEHAHEHPDIHSPGRARSGCARKLARVENRVHGGSVATHWRRASGHCHADCLDRRHCFAL